MPVPVLQRALALLNPVRSEQYLEQYHRLVTELDREQRQSKSEECQTRGWLNQQTIRSRPLTMALTLMKVMIAAKALQFGYRSLWTYQLSLNNRTVTEDLLLEWALHFDTFRLLLRGWADMNRLSVAISGVMLYFNSMLFGAPDLTLLRMLTSVVVEGRWNGRATRNNLNKNCERVRRSFVRTLRLLLAVVITFEVVFVYCWTRFTARLLREFTGNDLTTIDTIDGGYHYRWFLHSIAYLMGGQLSALVHFVCQLNLAHVVALNFALTKALLTVFECRMRDLSRFFARRVLKKARMAKSKRFNPQYYYFRYRKHYRSVMAFFFRCNRHHGRLFAVFLVGMCPVQVGLTVRLLRRSDGMPTTGQALILCWVVYLIYLCFVLHLAFARCTRLIHGPPARQWHSLAVGWSIGGQTGNVDAHAQLTLSLDVQTWHTRGRYGFTYGVFGLVTLHTFAKFVLLYGKFVLITYKLMHRLY